MSNKRSLEIIKRSCTAHRQDEKKNEEFTIEFGFNYRTKSKAHFYANGLDTMFPFVLEYGCRVERVMVCMGVGSMGEREGGLWAVKSVFGLCFPIGQIPEAVQYPYTLCTAIYRTKYRK